MLISSMLVLITALPTRQQKIPHLPPSAFSFTSLSPNFSVTYLPLRTYLPPNSVSCFQSLSPSPISCRSSTSLFSHLHFFFPICLCFSNSIRHFPSVLRFPTPSTVSQCSFSFPISDSLFHLCLSFHTSLSRFQFQSVALCSSQSHISHITRSFPV